VLITGTKRRLHRPDGSYLNFDKNRAVVYTAPTTFGPHKKSTMIPNLVATAVRGPVCRELRSTKWFSEKYRVLIKKAHTLV
jgi:ribosomal protein L14